MWNNQWYGFKFNSDIILSACSYDIRATPWELSIMPNISAVVVFLAPVDNLNTSPPLSPSITGECIFIVTLPVFGLTANIEPAIIPLLEPEVLALFRVLDQMVWLVH